MAGEGAAAVVGAVCVSGVVDAFSVDCTVALAVSSGASVMEGAAEDETAGSVAAGTIGVGADAGMSDAAAASVTIGVVTAAVTGAETDWGVPAPGGKDT